MRVGVVCSRMCCVSPWEMSLCFLRAPDGSCFMQAVPASVAGSRAACVVVAWEGVVEGLTDPSPLVVLLAVLVGLCGRYHRSGRHCPCL